MKNESKTKAPKFAPGAHIIPVEFSPVDMNQYTLACVKFDPHKNQWAEVNPKDWNKVIRNFRCGQLHLVEFKTSTNPLMGVAIGYLEQKPDMPQPLHYHYDHFCDDNGQRVAEAKTLLLMPGRYAYYQSR